MGNLRNRAARGAVALILPGMILAGCASTPELQPRLADIKMPDRALLVTEGIEIEVLDAEGSMPERIRPDEVFSPGRHVPAIANRADLQEVTVRGEQIGANGYPYFYEPGAYYGLVAKGVIQARRAVASALTGGKRAALQRERLLVRHVIPGSPADRAGLGSGAGTPIWDYEPQGDIWGIDRTPGERLSYMSCRSTQGECEPVRRSIQAKERARPYQVRVHVAGQERPLHGLLAFFPVFSTAEGSASRLHRIEIPERYIERAVGGGVSVVFQPYEARYRDAESGDIETTERVSWALWMSDVPFYE